MRCPTRRRACAGSWAGGTQASPLPGQGQTDGKVRASGGELESRAAEKRQRKASAAPSRAEPTPGKISERVPGAARRSAPTCAPLAKLRGLARRGGGGGRATAGSGPLAAEEGPRGHRRRWFPWRCGGKWSPAALAPSLKLRHWPWAGACGCWARLIRLGRQRKPTDSFHCSAPYPPAAVSCSAAGEGGREGTADG